MPSLKRPLLVTLLLSIFASGCITGTHAADDLQRERLLSSAVRIRSERNDGNFKVTGHGTAFAVDLSKWGYGGPTYLLSVAHNAIDENNQPYPTLKIESRNPGAPSWSSCRVVAFDKELDLCLLEANDPVPQQGVLAVGDEEAGELVTLAGSPRGIPVALFDGTLTKRFTGGSVRSSARLPFDHGCSGGPFFNAKGEVIGVAVAGVPKDGDMDKTIGLFVPLVGVTSFLESNRSSLVQNSGHARAAKVAPVNAQNRIKRNPSVEVQAASTQNRFTPAVKNSLPRIEMENEVNVGQLPTPSMDPGAVSRLPLALQAPTVGSPASPE